MKVSIITITFNSAETISDPITSVYKQSYGNIEHIIIDGSSTDNTVMIIRSLPSRVVTLVSESDKGIYDAINKGISAATGDIVGILNSDDFYSSPEIVSKVVEAFEQHEVDAIYGDVHFVSPADLNTCVRYYSSEIFRPSLFRFGFMPAHPSFFMKRSCYEKYGLYSTDYKIAADFELLVRYLFIHKINYRYLKMDFVTMRTGGISTKNWKSRLLLNREIVKACRKNGIYTNLFLVYLKYFYKIKELKSRL